MKLMKAQSSAIRSQMAGAGCAFFCSGLKAVLPYTYALADGSSYDCSTALSFDRSIGMLRYDVNTHLQLRGGSGVDARRPPFWERNCGGYKEM